ncbi:hypothetical protein Dsin_016195 [Dipteronia sinensis]|uniref:Uncharacterized protein n=1 Tax=Dipteronia sinensis TaxID=43782 RepID=A0AAE0E5E3_9ROSI|nr:hypothetical protein Dsin_016195 [Dipteronia sinensis]
MGIAMLPDSYMATLHHQIAYRLQDHALDLPIPGHSSDTIFIKTEREDEVPTIIQIPKQLPTDQLLELMPLSWITNYEKAFQNIVPVIASDTTYTRQPDGTIKIVYKPFPDVSASSSDIAPSAPSDPPIFQSLMIRPLTSEKEIPIHSFEADGSIIYTDKINGLLPQPSSQHIPYYMASSYDQDFLPLEPAFNHEKTRFSRPYVQSSEVLPDGSLNHPSHA